MIFLYNYDNTHAQTHAKQTQFFGKLLWTRSSENKIAEAIKFQITGEKQQFTWANKMLDDLTIRLK